jgi:hypothetical protein
MSRIDMPQSFVAEGEGLLERAGDVNEIDRALAGFDLFALRIEDAVTRTVNTAAICAVPTDGLGDDTKLTMTLHTFPLQPYRTILTLARSRRKGRSGESGTGSFRDGDIASASCRGCERRDARDCRHRYTSSGMPTDLPTETGAKITLHSLSGTQCRVMIQSLDGCPAGTAIAALASGVAGATGIGPSM